MRGLIPVLGADPYAATLGGYSAGGGAPAAENTIAMSPAFSAEPTVFSMTITVGSVSTVLPLVTSAATLFAATITTTIGAVVPLVTSTATIFDPTVTLGGVTAVLPLVTSTQTVFDADVSTATTTAVQLETADALLLETNDKLLVESGVATKVTALSSIGTLGADDLVYVLNDPAGTPVDRKVTVAALTAFILS